MARNNDSGRITLTRTSAGWFARFRGQVAEDVQMAFGTTTIPTAFTAEARPADVQRYLAAQWPKCDVRLAQEPTGLCDKCGGPSPCRSRACVDAWLSDAEYYEGEL